MLDPHQALQKKTELFSDKNDKKGSQNRVRLNGSLYGDFQFFCEFPGSEKSKMKCQERENGVGPAAMRPVKITKFCHKRADRH